MGTTFLFFIDDSGKNGYSQYVSRGGLLISAGEYISLANEIKATKVKHKFGAYQETKWSDLTIALTLKDKDPHRIFKKTKSWAYLQAHTSEQIKQYILDIFSLLPKYNIKIISTIAIGLPGHAEHFIYKAELQNLMQRVQHELKGTEDNAILIYDSECKEKENQLKDAYNKITETDPFIAEYRNIIDNLFCETSNYSAGIQMADYIEGAIVASLRGYPFSKEIYKKYIFQKLRKSSGFFQRIVGYGLLAIPTNNDTLNKSITNNLIKIQI